MFLDSKSLAFIVGVLLLKVMLPAQAQLDLSGAGILQVLGEKQYFVEKGAKVNFHRALQLCAAMNMTLASIESSTEQQNLKVLLYSKSALTRDYWLSGNDLPLLREFVWFGTGNLFSYTSWSAERTNLNQRCVRTDRYFNWRRDYCTNSFYFICEKPVLPACGANGECISKPMIIY